MTWCFGLGVKLYSLAPFNTEIEKSSYDFNHKYHYNWIEGVIRGLTYIFLVLQVRAVGLNDKNFPIGLEWPKSFVGDREEAYRPI